MTTMISRISAVLLEALTEDYVDVSELSEKILREMREPTPAMTMAALRVALTKEHFGVDWTDSRDLTEEEKQAVGFTDILAGDPSHWERPAWRAMIDAALKETKE